MIDDRGRSLYGQRFHKQFGDILRLFERAGEHHAALRTRGDEQVNTGLFYLTLPLLVDPVLLFGFNHESSSSTPAAVGAGPVGVDLNE